MKKISSCVFLISLLQVGTAFALEPSDSLDLENPENLNWDDPKFLESMTNEFAKLFEADLSRDANGTFIDSRAHDLSNLFRFVFHGIPQGQWNGFGPSFYRSTNYTYANDLSPFHSVDITINNGYYELSIYASEQHKYLLSRYKSKKRSSQSSQYGYLPYESVFAKKLREEAANLEFESEFDELGAITNPLLRQKMGPLASLYTHMEVYTRLWEMLSEDCGFPDRQTSREYAAKIFFKLKNHSKEMTPKPEIYPAVVMPGNDVTPKKTVIQKTLITSKELKKDEQDDIPWGIVVTPGKLVKSPFVISENSTVDVSDFKHGQKVRCPYTGKIFKVP